MNSKTEEILDFVLTRTKEMKRIVKISEKKLEMIVSTIMEQVENLQYYEDEDFYDAFFLVFRQWIFEKIGDEYKKYPMSLLLKKYGKDFEKDMGILEFQDYEGGKSFDRYRVLTGGRSLVKNQKHILPSLSKEEKFIDKYKNVISHIIDELDYPDFVSVVLEEDRPNSLHVKFNIDFVEMLNSKQYERINRYDLDAKFRNYVSGFLGVEFGNPAHGQISMSSSLNYVGADEWVKNVLNKKIKKEIKKLPNANIIHSIRFETFGGYATLRIIFKDSAGYGKRTGLLLDIKNYIESLGYNSEILRVER
jgi:hypothetical protein